MSLGTESNADINKILSLVCEFKVQNMYYISVAVKYSKIRKSNCQLWHKYFILTFLRDGKSRTDFSATFQMHWKLNGFGENIGGFLQEHLFCKR